MITTTLNQIKEKNPCADGWKTLLESLCKTKADDESLPLAHILESNCLDDALWALRALTGEDIKKAKLFICDIAERALRFAPEGETRPANSIAVSRGFINGECSLKELKEARRAATAAAYAAAYAATAAATAADAAAYAAAYAATAAATAATATAADAAADAADAAATAADAYAYAAAATAADAYAYAAARKEEREVQKQMFIEFCNG